MAAKSEYTMVEAAGLEVRLSNPGKVYFPKPGWTKLDLVEYYLMAADAVLTQIRERPTVMKRFVNGITEEPIWQKRVPKNIPDWLQTATVAFPSGRTAEELVANDEAHLVWAVNLGVIDFNPHPVRRTDLEHPDELRVDLDPTPEVGWAEVRKTAMVVEEVLREHGLRGYPKTSGSKGIHVNVRDRARWDYLEVRRAALALAREVERRAPDLATSKWWKEERHGVFVDYNQNARDRTVASGYSVRPTVDARVSCALHWDEVPDAEPGDFRLDTMAERLKTVGDPAADIDLEPGSLDAAARPRPPRRGGRARRRALAAALPEAARRAQARPAVARHRPPDHSAAAPATRSRAARRPASTSASPSAASARSPGRARATRRRDWVEASDRGLRAGTRSRIAARLRRRLGGVDEQRALAGGVGLLAVADDVHAERLFALGRAQRHHQRDQPSAARTSRRRRRPGRRARPGPARRAGRRRRRRGRRRRRSTPPRRRSR